jgi:hypothetical protein
MCCGDGDSADEVAEFGCVTRLWKNIRFLQQMRPPMLPAEEPPGGFTSVIPADVLATGHLGATAVRGGTEPAHPAAAALADAFRQVGGDAPEALFRGTVYFVQLTYTDTSTGRPFKIPVADILTAIFYSTLAAKPISNYASQYGYNSLAISPSIIPFARAKGSTTTYSDDDLRGWVNEVAAILPADACVAILNPPGLTNSKTAGTNKSYHNMADVPYLWVNVRGSNWTVDDKQDNYAAVLSHELAEMVVDPKTDFKNPEVCDSCGDGKCVGTPWFHVFNPDGSYIRSTQGRPPGFPYGFFIASIAAPPFAPQCAGIPESACNYAPPFEPAIETIAAPAGTASGEVTVQVATGVDGTVYYNWWRLGDGPRGWKALPGLSTQTAPAAALTGSNNDYLFVMAVDGDGHLKLNQGTLGKPFVGWQ